MVIDLTKGGRFDLTKSNPAVSKYEIGLGWKENENVGAKFDLDVSAFVLDSSGKLTSAENFVYYKNLSSPNGFVTHTGDNTTGEGDGDDETMFVDFDKAVGTEKSIVFVVTIHDADVHNQNFGQVRDAYIRILNADSGEEILKYELDEDYSVETAVNFGRLYERNGAWKFEAVGAGKIGGLQAFVDTFK